jgi:hypothetical protein
VKKRRVPTLLFSIPIVVITAAVSMFTINVVNYVNLELHSIIVQFRTVYYVHFSVLVSFMFLNERFDSNASNVNTIHD